MSKIENRILSDHVYERIREMILNGELPPGAKINKNELAERLDVSLTPINASIARLAGEKLIEQRSRYGFFVKTYSCKELQDLYTVRAGLEGIAVRLCIEEATDEELEELENFFTTYSLPLTQGQRKEYMQEDKSFHYKMILYSKNQMIKDMNDSFAYLTRSYQKGLVRAPEDTLQEHRDIVEAIRIRDGVHAQEMLIRHHLASRDILRERCKDLKEGGIEL